MKKTITLTLFLIATFLISCSSDGSSNNNQIDGTWKLGNYLYERGTSEQSRVPSNDGQLFIIVSSTSGQGNLGEYSGSSVTCKFYDRGPGEYTIINDNTFDELINPSEKYITLDCSIGTATSTGSILYGSPNSTSKAILSIENNQYKIIISNPVTFTKILEINGGIANAAESYPFVANKIF